MSKGQWAAALALTVSACAMGTAARAQDLNVYCSMQVEWCQGMAVAFQSETGIKVNMVQKSVGETFAQIRAEKDNPRGDVWYGGTQDPHLVAATEGLTQEYTPKAMNSLHPWAQNQWAQSKKRSVGVYSGALGIGFNKEVLAKKKIPEPKCWADLLKADYKGEIQMPNPNSSGTAYLAIATLVQLMGEEQAFDYLKKLHANINAYPRSGAGPIKAAARGETGVAINFIHDTVTEQKAGFPVGYNAPCEGTAYEIGSMSIITGARNLASAQRFYEWALQPAAQKIGYEVGKMNVSPSNTAAEPPSGAPDLTRLKLVNYDFIKYGSAAERKRLLDRWEKDVNSIPR